MPSFLEQAKKKFAEKKILIFGLGLQGGGEGVMKFFLSAGARVKVTDLRSKKDFRRILKKFSGKADFVLGRHRASDLKWADIIIKNPGVSKESPFMKYAKKIGKTVLSETQIFFDLVPEEKIIGVTGTKGKTTTSTLLAHILSSRFDVKLIGNMPGRSPLETLINLKKAPDFFVYELSSFNLEGLNKSPKYAVITNIFPDHLNRHKTFKEYKKTKENIFRHQKSGGRFWIGEPNSAQKVALFLGVKASVIKKELKTFKPPEGRIEFIGKIKGVSVINDTTATNPGATLFSLERVKNLYKVRPSRIILIAGGENKNLDYSVFSKKIGNLKKAVLVPGTASNLVKGKNISRARSLKEALDAAFSSAKKGDYILFSPGASSFNVFKNEFERGRAFKKIVKSYKKL